MSLIRRRSITSSCEAIVLPELYQRVVLPSAVYNELNHARTPPIVRGWVSNLPIWASIRTPAKAAEFDKLGLGEREAISLAKDLHADYLLIDERLAREVAAASGLAVVGTVGVLEPLAKGSLISPHLLKSSAEPTFVVSQTCSKPPLRVFVSAEPGRAVSMKPQGAEPVYIVGGRL